MLFDVAGPDEGIPVPIAFEFGQEGERNPHRLPLAPLGLLVGDGDVALVVHPIPSKFGHFFQPATAPQRYLDKQSHQGTSGDELPGEERLEFCGAELADGLRVGFDPLDLFEGILLRQPIRWHDPPDALLPRLTIAAVE
jgi:hypothetical protein